MLGPLSAGALLLALLAVACGGGEADAPAAGAPDASATALDSREEADQPAAEPAETEPQAAAAGPRYGVAGVVPPHWPEPSNADYETLLGSLDETGGLFGVYLNCVDAEGQDDHIPVAVHFAYRTEAEPVVAIGFDREGPDGRRQTTLNWQDPAEVEAFQAVLVAVAEEYAPRLFGIGNEMDRYAADRPADYAAFVAALPGLVAAIHEASPETRVYTSFQYESLRGLPGILGPERASQWEVLGGVLGVVDLVGFTTYPFFAYETPEAMPADYYAPIAEHVDGPVLFTEIGWPSAPIPGAPRSGFDGTPEEQAALVARLPELWAPLDVAAALWAFPYDLGEADAGVRTFASVALRTNDGEAKPALAEWMALLAG